MPSGLSSCLGTSPERPLVIVVSDLLAVPGIAQGLDSLQAMRAPVAVLWDLENFILSEPYTDLRLKLQTMNRVLVPNTLKRLTSIR